MIEEAWTQAVLALGGEPVATDLVQRYSEPHRRYHDVRHVEAVVRDSDGLVPLGQQESALLALAACAHDVVYDARPGQDERRSAEWARSWLQRSGLAPDLVERVEQLVLTTLSHDADPADDTASALLDADLAILGSSPVDYDRYSRAVRMEFSAVDDSAWAAGRAQVLTSLLERRPLYRTEQGRGKWEAAAKRNLARELDTLKP